MIPEHKWKWFGMVGHFICGPWCRFHLCTQVGGFLVSTIGFYVPARCAGGSEQTEHEWLRAHPNGEQIGSQRFYETMVFKAGKPCRVKKCNCGLPLPQDWGELDTAGYQTQGEATEGHRRMCLKIAKQPRR